MTTYQNQVAAEATIAGAAWGRLFGAAVDAIAGCFARRETRATAAEMVAGLLAEVDTRNCWTLAEALGHPGPHRLQHLLSRARFDHGRAREEIARLIVRELAGQDVVLVADETGDAKSSTDCVGAGRQYSGALKGVGMCQVAVHLAAVTASVRVVIDRVLYLPKDWAADEERREVVGVPEEITFATKLQQTAAMVENALELGVQARWFAGDEVYSGRELRKDLRELGLGYAVGVSHSYTVTDGAGRRWKARQMINKVLPHQWMRMRTGHGTKGTREYDWAWLDVRADDTPNGHGDDGTSVLVARRHRYTGEISFFRCWSPAPVTLAQLVEVICRRWRIEETFQLGKTFTGLDEGQVTCWNSWMRWSLFSLVASAVLALTAAAATTMTGPAGPARLVPLTCPELVRLLRAFVLTPPVRDAEHTLRWMAWRRHHQAVAGACHQRRHALQDQP
ncbi:IS701 family transposase [Streptomyces sp. NPDC004561]